MILLIASRYTEGGEVSGWSTKRKLISKTAKGIAKAGLGVNESDPMSGFFAFNRNILEGIKFDAIGYKMLLEILVKTKGAKVKEIPYTFTDRTRGSSKLDSSTMFDYVKSVWKLYRYGHTAKVSDTRTSVRFISKAGRFYTVGAIWTFGKLSCVTSICGCNHKFLVHSCNNNRNSGFNVF